jgi:hypothetical protein
MDPQNTDNDYELEIASGGIDFEALLIEESKNSKTSGQTVSYEKINELLSELDPHFVTSIRMIESDKDINKNELEV